MIPTPASISTQPTSLSMREEWNTTIQVIYDKLKKTKEIVSTEEELQILAHTYELLRKIQPTNESETDEHCLLLSAILGRYGRRLKPDYALAVIFLGAALDVLFYKNGSRTVLQFHTLAEIKEKKPDFQSRLAIQTAHTNYFIDEAPKFSFQHQLDYAQTLLSINYCMQALGPQYVNMDQKEFIPQLIKIYQSVRGILSRVESHTQESLDALTGSHINIFLCSVYQAILNNREINEKDLDQLIREYLYSIRTFHQTDATEASIQTTIACYLMEYSPSKLQEAKQCAVNGFELFRKVLADLSLSPKKRQLYEKYCKVAYDTYFSISYLQGNPTIQEIEEYKDLSKQFYEKDKENQQAMIYLLNLAWWEIYQNNPLQAQTYLNEIERISKRFPNWSRTEMCITKKNEMQAWIARQKKKADTVCSTNSKTPASPAPSHQKTHFLVQAVLISLKGCLWSSIALGLYYAGHKFLKIELKDKKLTVISGLAMGFLPNFVSLVSYYAGYKAFPKNRTIARLLGFFARPISASALFGRIGLSLSSTVGITLVSRLTTIRESQKCIDLLKG